MTASTTRRPNPSHRFSRFGALSGLYRSVATTAMSNVFAVAAAGVAGIIIARGLGPTHRGEYAAVTAWFGFALIVGDLGQAAATTFHVARDHARRSDYVVTARRIMTGSGTALLAIGLGCVPLLAHRDGALAWGYRIMAAACLVSLLGSCYTAALQASWLPRWNFVRILQPLSFVVAIALLHALGRLTLLTALGALAATVAVRGLFAFSFCRVRGLTGGEPSLTLARPMARYGLSQFAASIPTVLTARLDQLVLSLAATPVALGNYAVAASLTALAVPIVSAAGHVSMPRLASRQLSGSGIRQLQRWALLTSAGIGTAAMLALALTATWLVPTVFGAAYQGAVLFVVLLAPGGVFLACGQVCGDLLNGRGRPLIVARAQGAAAAVTVVLLAVLLPTIGVAGAAVASTVATGVALAMMLHAIRRLPDDGVDLP